MANKLKEVFVYVDDDDVDKFIESHTSSDSEEILDMYTDKISFLGSTGKIVTHGRIYGSDNEVFIGKVTDAPDTAKIIIDTEEDESVEVYTKSEIDTKLLDYDKEIFVGKEADAPENTKLIIDSVETTLEDNTVIETTVLKYKNGDEYIPVELNNNTDDEIFIGNEEDAVDGAKLIVNLDDTDDTASTYSKDEVNYLVNRRLPLKIAENVIETTKEITGDKYYIWGVVSELNITLADPTVENAVVEYNFEFSSGTTPTTLSLPVGLKWASSKVIEADKTYQVSILHNIITMFSIQ